MDILVTNNFDILNKIKGIKTIVVSGDIGKILLFHAIHENPKEMQEKVIALFSKYGNNKEDYYDVRTQYNFYHKPEMFYYLWQLGYYQKSRYNGKGEFNTGFGDNQEWDFNPNHITEIAPTLTDIIFNYTTDILSSIMHLYGEDKNNCVIALWENSIDKFDIADIARETKKHEIPTFLITKSQLPFDAELEYVETQSERQWQSWAFENGIANEIAIALS